MRVTHEHTARQLIFAAAAACHLLLVAVGAMQINLAALENIPSLLRRYVAVSGANSGYGFFAPGVGSQLKASFDVVDAAGTTYHERLETGESHEADLRVGNIVGQFWDEYADRAIQRSLAASWAAEMIARHPSAREVVVRLERYDLPTMADYHGGKRPRWEPFYRARFVHGDR